MIFYVDFDGVLVDSASATVKILNKKYNKNFKANEIISWNFEQYKKVTLEEIDDIFISDIFFDTLEFYPNSKEWVKENYQNIKIITKGIPINIEKKKIFLNKHGLGDIEVIGVKFEENKDDYIEDKNSVLIDDSVENLITSNCKYNILYLTNPLAEWQKYPNGKAWDGLTINNFNQIIKKGTDYGIQNQMLLL